jgi:hypothetical protein
MPLADIVDMGGKGGVTRLTLAAAGQARNKPFRCNPGCGGRFFQTWPVVRQAILSTTAPPWLPVSS